MAECREELVAAFKNRAMVYKHVLDELRATLGEEEARATLRRAILRHGEGMGHRFERFAPSDLHGLAEAFLAGIPDEGRMFAPRVDRQDAEGLDIVLTECPLKAAWMEAGLPDEEVELLCAIAGMVDVGTFASAGFEFSIETWKPGREGCCHLHIRPG